MLLGEFEHTIDDKNRLTLPAKFRERFPAALVLTRGMDGCLYVYPARGVGAPASKAGSPGSTRSAGGRA